MISDPPDNRPVDPPEPSVDDGIGPSDSRASPPPPGVPRPVTPFVRRRAWSDPRVRFWVLAAVVLLLLAGYFTLNALRARAHEAWLIEHGVQVNATVYIANGEPIRGRPQPPDSAVTLRFRWQGEDFEPRPAYLPGRTEFITTGATLPIHVNPQDPTDWTWLEPLPLMNRAVGTIITLPMAMLALLWAAVCRARLLQTWREGEAVECLIVETCATAVAPRCRAVRVTPVDESDKRIYAVFLPRSAAGLSRGDSIHLVRRSTRAASAMAAVWFER